MERTELLIEADRRGLLKPEQKAELDAALQSGAGPEQSTAAKVGKYLTQDVPHQAALGVRGLVKGVSEIPTMMADVVAAPVRAVTGGALFSEAPSEWRERQLNRIAEPQNANERVAQDVISMMSGQGVLTAGGRAITNIAGPVVREVGGRIGEVVRPVARRVGEALSSSPVVQTVAAGGSGAAGGAVREGGFGPIDQFAGSVVGGFSTAGLTALGMKAYKALSSAIGSAFKPNQDIAQINITLNQILQQNGIDVSQVPAQLRQQLVEEVRKATATGGQLNPEVVRRIADYGVVGATPTLGRVTRDPSQVTQEKNLAKTGANTTDERLQELANIQNENNKRMIAFLNEQGAGGTQGPLAGQKGIDLIAARNAAWKAREKALHEAARDTGGRQIELDSQGFVTEAYNNLAAANKGPFLPPQIKALLQQYWKGTVTGPDGTEVATPFNADAIDNLKTTLAAATRAADRAGDGNAKAAIAQVRNAIENVQPRAQGRPVGGNQVVDPAQMGAAQTQADTLSAESMEAFDRARRFSRAKHKWLESTPGIEAALNDPNPETYIQTFIIGSGDKAKTAEVERLVFQLRKDPEVMQATKEHIANWLKQKALSGASDEVGNFSQSGYNKALNEIGEAKLRLFFTPAQVAQLKTLGRVASYEMVDPKGSAVNYSNSGAMITAKALALLDKLPFGEAAVSGPARNIVNRAGANQALNVAPGMRLAPPRLPQAVEPSIVDKLFGPSLLAGAGAKQPRDDDKDR